MAHRKARLFHPPRRKRAILIAFLFLGRVRPGNWLAAQNQPYRRTLIRLPPGECFCGWRPLQLNLEQVSIDITASSAPCQSLSLSTQVVEPRFSYSQGTLKQRLSVRLVTPTKVRLTESFEYAAWNLPGLASSNCWRKGARRVVAPSASP